LGERKKSKFVLHTAYRCGTDAIVTLRLSFSLAWMRPGTARLQIERQPRDVGLSSPLYFTT